MQRRQNVVPLAIAGVLGVLVLVFHARLLAWFRGEHPEGAWSGASVTAAGEWQIAASLEPDPPQQRGNRVRVEVKDGSGQPLERADVTITYDMAAMGAMPEMKSRFIAKSTRAGVYEASFDLPMAGSWTIIAGVTAAGSSASARYTLTVGTKGLTPLGAEGGGAPAAGSNMATGSDAASGGIAYYTCSMHPSVHAHEPGTCPVCSMNLTPVLESDQLSGVVRIDEARLRAIGVRTEKAVKAPLTLDIRAVGKLTYDETRLQDVVLKVSGFLSGLRITATGQAVKKGEALFQLYSPELYAAEQDYLVARSSRGALGSAGRGDELVRAAETRLALLGLSAEQIQAIAKTGAPIENLTFRAPASGYVIEKNVVEGAAIRAGDRVFRIAALDKVWVEAEVFEADLGRIAKGQPATIALSYIPDRTFDGKVTFVYPYLDPSSRTGRVRIELPNAGLELKPDMYANVTFHQVLPDRLQIPTSAILYTGPRRIVLVDLGGGRLAPREVKIGAQSGDRAEVLSGLVDGEAVVSAGNFLIAAESRIRSSGTFWKETP
jgi:Cu(I)/Ag(I) efflux system membrane fusion protein